MHHLVGQKHICIYTVVKKKIEFIQYKHAKYWQVCLDHILYSKYSSIIVICIESHRQSQTAASVEAASKLQKSQRLVCHSVEPQR